MTHRRRLVVLFLLAAGTVAVAGQRDPFPDGAGKDVLLDVCQDCHGPDIVLVTRKTPEQWAKALKDMAALGVQGSPDQFAAIARYLDRHFAVVKVNLADAGELAATLGVTVEVAEAVVAYRTDHGSFATIDDLRKVPALRPETIDAAKDRFAFDPATGAGRSQRSPIRSRDAATSHATPAFAWPQSAYRSNSSPVDTHTQLPYQSFSRAT